MKIIECTQGTPEWLRARIGIPTASCFDKLLSPKKLDASTSAVPYRNMLLAEWLTGYPADGIDNAWMERGRDMEAEARAFYAFDRDVEVQQVGFVTLDDGSAGCSPDGLVGNDGGCELKCPSLHVHISYMLDPTALVAAYRGQVQGSLYVTERKWWDIVAYNPDLPSIVVRVEPDPEYQDALHKVLTAFNANLEEMKRRLAQYRVALEPAA